MSIKLDVKKKVLKEKNSLHFRFGESSQQTMFCNITRIVADLVSFLVRPISETDKRKIWFTYNDISVPLRDKLAELWTWLVLGEEGSYGSYYWSPHSAIVFKCVDGDGNNSEMIEIRNWNVFADDIIVLLGEWQKEIPELLIIDSKQLLALLQDFVMPHMICSYRDDQWDDD